MIGPTDETPLGIGENGSGSAPSVVGGLQEPDPSTPDGAPAESADPTGRICPHLRLSGRRWRLAGPSGEHRCDVEGDGSQLSEDTQRRLCLVPAHVTCPVFESASLSRRRWAGSNDGALSEVRRATVRNRWAFVPATPVVVGTGSAGGAQGFFHGRAVAQTALVVLLIVAFVAVIVSRLPGDDGGALLAPSPSVTRSPVPSFQTSPSSAPSQVVTPPPSRSPTPSPLIESTPTPVPPTPATYRVVSGDTLSGLAARWGTTVTAIMQLNGLTSTLIRVGQILLIPSPPEPSPSAPAAPTTPSSSSVASPGT